MDIKTIFIDFDGVLTDGKLNMSHQGELFRSVHSRDIRAIRELNARGFEVIICTASSSAIIREYANRVGAQLIVARDKELIAAAYENFIAVGDDVWDLPLLKKAVYAFAPADCDKALHNKVKLLSANGGAGVIAELLPLLYAQNIITNEF